MFAFFNERLCLYLLITSILGILFAGCIEKDTSGERGQNENQDLNLKLENISSEITMHPDRGDLYYSRAEIYNEHGMFENAIADLEMAVKIDPFDTRSWHLMANILLDNFQSRRALEAMEEAASKNPDSLNTWLKLSEFQLILKRYPEGLQTLNTIQKKYPLESEIFFMKGMILKETGNLEAAKNSFILATREDPDFIDAWINAGQVSELLNDTGAVKYYLTALQISSGSVQVLHALAQHYSNQNQLAKAINQYKELIRKDPSYTDAYYNAGLIYLDMDSLNQAFNHFNILINMNPGFAPGYYYRGLVSEFLGNFRSAEADYTQALNLDSENIEFREAKERIEDKLTIQSN